LNAGDGGTYPQLVEIYFQELQNTMFCLNEAGRNAKWAEPRSEENFHLTAGEANPTCREGIGIAKFDFYMMLMACFQDNWKDTSGIRADTVRRFKKMKGKLRQDQEQKPVPARSGKWIQQSLGLAPGKNLNSRPAFEKE